MMRIRISWQTGAVEAIIDSTPTAKKVWQALPCSASASTWGEEVYFEMPVTAELEPDARQVVDKGTVCFWVEGRSLALPYGPTPISQGDECRLVSEVNVLGRIDGDARVLTEVVDGASIKVERVE
jgi:hypothetical protein